LLGLTGFISSREGAMPEQPENAIFAIRMCVSIVPFLLAVAAAFLIRFYRLDSVTTEPAGAGSTE
jgi:Na+/melibiose symporter-like transporter